MPWGDDRTDPGRGGSPAPGCAPWPIILAMTATTRTGPAAALWLLPGVALLGVLAGVAAKAADESGLRWAADLGSYPAAWVLAVALLGRLPRPGAPRPPARRRPSPR